MNLSIGSPSKLLNGDQIVSLVLRTDAAPVPVTLEGTIRLDERFLPGIQEDQIVYAGRDQLAFRIVANSLDKDVTAVQGSQPYGQISFIALLDACHKVSFRRKTAVIKSRATLGEIYRACGATVQIDSDFTVDRFASYVGDVPTFRIAQALQEEGGAVFWNGKRLQFIRLPDLLKKKPVAQLPADTLEDISSGFMERHEVPFFYSIDPGGGFVFGNRNKARAAQYIPRQDTRVLTNMTRVLVQRKTLKSPYAPAINAGDLILVENTPYPVVTAAHVYQSGTDGSAANTYSKFWLGSVEE
ncbi:hypothetical protein [Cupriavidus basilensis]|uniref:hypothetical protein n=1 Tax=Cupriavidus basilensis TaxID=68895 RepID=UPI001186916B|nr:hypothetical protein [Cupriavidus basilensis]